MRARALATPRRPPPQGIIAKGEDMREAFGTDDHMKVALVILEKGELEVSGACTTCLPGRRRQRQRAPHFRPRGDTRHQAALPPLPTSADKERALLFDQLFRDIATIIADKCVNPQTSRPYTVTLIEKALRDAHFSVNPAKNAKQQALKAVALLQRSLPIERARMRLRLTVPRAAYAGLRSLLLDAMHAVVDDEGRVGDMSTIDVTVEPGCYRQIDEEVASRSSGAGSLAVLSLSVQTDGGEDGDGGDDDGGGGGGAVAGSGRGAGGGGHAGGASASVSDTRAGGGGAGADAHAHASARGGDGTAGAVAAAAHAMGGLDIGSGGGGGATQSRGGVAAEATEAASRGTGMAVRRVTQPGRRLACGTCGVAFEAAEEHRAHARSDLHHFNLKRRSRALEAVTADAYAALPADVVKRFVENYDS